MRPSSLETRGRGGSERGVSLVELMFLMAACAVLIGALLSGIVSMSSDRQLREERMLAINACRNVLEELRRETVANVQAADGRGFTVPGINGNGIGLKARRSDPDQLPGRISVQPERTYGTMVLYRVTISVDWEGGSPNAHEHMTTLMGEAPMIRNAQRQGGFTLVELTIVSVVLVVLLIGLGATSGIASRTMQTNERRDDSCEKVLRCFQRIRQFTRGGVLSTYKVLATAADVSAGRAAAAGEWIDPVDGERRTAVRFRAADGNLAVNASSLTPPIELRFELDDAEDPAANPRAADGQDDDRDGLIDEGQVCVTYDGVQTGLSTGIESCWLTLSGSLLTVQIRTARSTTSDRQFFFEQVFTLRNN